MAALFVKNRLKSSIHADCLTNKMHSGNYDFAIEMTIISRYMILISNSSFSVKYKRLLDITTKDTCLQPVTIQGSFTGYSSNTSNSNVSKYPKRTNSLNHCHLQIRSSFEGCRTVLFQFTRRKNFCCVSMGSSCIHLKLNVFFF